MAGNNNQKSYRYSYYKPFVVYGVLVVAFAAAIGVVSSSMIIAERKDKEIAEIEHRVALSVSSKAEILSTWLDGMRDLGNHITNSDLIRIFSAEVYNAKNEEDVNKSSLAEQLPYMQNVLQSFVEENKLNSVQFYNEEGKPYLASGTAKVLKDHQLVALKHVFKNKEGIFLPIFSNGNDLFMDYLKPVFLLDDEDKNPAVVGVMLTEIPVSSALKKHLEATVFSKYGEREVLYQINSGKISLLYIDNGFVDNKVIDGTPDIGEIKVSNSIADGKKVFVKTAVVDDSPLIVSHEFDKKQAMSGFNVFKATTISTASVMIAFIGALVLAFVWFQIGKRNRKRVRIQEQTMTALVKTVELRDSYLFGHHERVSRLALEIASVMGYDVEDRSTLYYSAQLSGIGKIFVPQEVLTKSGELTALERKKMEKHVTNTLNILQDMEFDFPVTEVIADMYERMDGSGYPDGDIGQDLNPLSRILGAADVYCALTSPRSYREALNAAEAVKVMRSESEKYDIKVLDVIESLEVK